MATGTPAATRAAPSTTAQNGPQTAPGTGAVVAATPGTNPLALPADLVAELAAEAKDEAAKERPTVSRISLRSGQMAYRQQPVPGNAMDVVVIATGFRNVWYSQPFDPDNIVNPDCFALGDDPEAMEPHENVKSPPSQTCANCKNMAWGSAMRNGKPSRGKACKETRRLVLMAANELKSVESIKSAELAILDVPVTSVGHWANFVNTINTTLNVPFWCVITNVSVKPHQRNQFEVTFTPINVAGDVEVIRALKLRREDAARIAMQPYEGTGGENDPDATSGNAAEKAPPAAAKKF